MVGKAGADEVIFADGPGYGAPGRFQRRRIAENLSLALAVLCWQRDVSVEDGEGWTMKVSG